MERRTFFNKPRLALNLLAPMIVIVIGIAFFTQASGAASLIIGAIVFVALLLVAVRFVAARIVADSAGMVIHNPFTTRRVAWNDVHGISFGRDFGLFSPPNNSADILVITTKDQRKLKAVGWMRLGTMNHKRNGASEQAARTLNEMRSQYAAPPRDDRLPDDEVPITG